MRTRDLHTLVVRNSGFGKMQSDYDLPVGSDDGGYASTSHLHRRQEARRELHYLQSLQQLAAQPAVSGRFALVQSAYTLMHGLPSHQCATPLVPIDLNGLPAEGIAENEPAQEVEVDQPADRPVDAQPQLGDPSVTRPE
ncbi:hypothetical protein R1sor_018155 [Riccia sorocarpa]|uniref:Uncharacterized protein n=1 Tax=Riccia sorocarpa TaxID=122646 RepID=A0ABD3I8X2_9MARC